MSEHKTYGEIAKIVGKGCSEIRRLIETAPPLMLPENVRQRIQGKQKQKIFSLDEYKFKNPLL